MRLLAAVTGTDVPFVLLDHLGLEAVLERNAHDAFARHDVACVVLSHQRAAHARAYHVERSRRDSGSAPLLFLDLPTDHSAAGVRYAEARLRQLAQRLAAITGRVVSGLALRDAIDAADAARSDAGANGAVGGVALLGAGPDDAQAWREAGGPPLAWVEGVDGYGAEPTGPLAKDPWTDLALRHLHRAASSTRSSGLARVRAAVDRADAVRAREIALMVPAHDGSAAWFAAEAVPALRARGFDVVQAPSIPDLLEKLKRGDRGAPVAPTPSSSPSDKSPQTTAPAGTRSRKGLASTAGFGAYQRDWFAGLRRQVEAGAPFAVVGADCPQEILRAMDIPFVVNQWWASIVSAKQETFRYRAALAEHGYPDWVEPYNTQGLADVFIEPSSAPWGGLPVPDVLFCMKSQDVEVAIHEAWARETGAELVAFERTVECRAEFPVEWWDLMPTKWETTLEPERLDLMADEIHRAVSVLERRTGRSFDVGRFAEVMALVNEQEEYFRRTRDLIARTVPAPISIVDSMPATMIPQWHRGTEWGRDAARGLFLEVQSLVDQGQAACPDERIRLMWVGRGLWQNMGLYQAFEESHGAVFVWSMYLGLAADGYLRYTAEGDDLVRALASRFVTVGDELRMPAWASAWHVNEARRHGVHAAVAVDDAEPAVLDSLEAAGVPVLRLAFDNLSTAGVSLAREEIERFLNERFGPA